MTFKDIQVVRNGVISTFSQCDGGVTIVDTCTYVICKLVSVSDSLCYSFIPLHLLQINSLYFSMSYAIIMQIVDKLSFLVLNMSKAPLSKLYIYIHSSDFMDVFIFGPARGAIPKMDMMRSHFAPTFGSRCTSNSTACLTSKC